MQREKLSPMGARIYTGMLAIGNTSVRDVARKANVPHQTLHRWMHEHATSTDARSLLRVADAVGLSLNWILDGEGSPHKRMPVSPTEAQLVESYRRLTPHLRCILLHCAQDLLNV